MRILFFLILLFSSYVIKSQNIFSGVYTGAINGDPATITINQQGMNVTGQYQETSNTYLIRGNIESNILHGLLTLPDNGMQIGTFDAALNTQGLHIDFLLLGTTKVSADFIKSPVYQNEVSANPTIGNNIPKDNFNRDPLVVGHWIKEEVINSGFGDNSASMTTAYYLTFMHDGTFVQEKASGAGGSNWSGGSNRTLDASGQWYTKDQVMYVRPQGQSDYVRLNQYLFHDGALVFKTQQGKYLIWNKN